MTESKNAKSTPQWNNFAWDSLLRFSVIWTTSPNWNFTKDLITISVGSFGKNFSIAKATNLISTLIGSVKRWVSLFSIRITLTTRKNRGRGIMNKLNMPEKPQIKE